MTSSLLSGQRKQEFLVIHHNAPGQFRHLIEYLLALGHKVVFASQTQSRELPKGATRIRLPSKKKKTHGNAHGRMEFEWELYEKFARKHAHGLNPDWIILHAGWGLGLALRGIFPTARILSYAEWWFDMNMADFRFDPHNPDVQFPEELRLAMVERNRRFACELLMADQVVAPTHWQRQQLPPRLQEGCAVIHEGIDTHFFSPEQRRATGECPAELAGLPDPATPVITYATRGMDPYRGFPEAVGALIKLLKRHPRIQVAIAGEDRVVYAPSQRKRRYGQEAKSRFAEVGLASRVHFLGHLPLPVYRQLLLRSDLHLYFSRPYVLSWSLLEAMACGCSIVASNVEPVREVIRDGVHGRLVDHTSADLADQIERALHDPAAPQRRLAARRRVCRHFEKSQSLKAYSRLFWPEASANQLR